MVFSSLDLVNQTTGEVPPLQDIVNASQVNPSNRRKAIMARIKGIETHAKAQGHEALFVTITCPSRMHPRHVTGERNGRYDGKEAGRDRYVSDAEFLAVWDKAHPTLRDAMDLALLTGQRPADVLKIKRADIHDGALWIVQNKTGTKRAIEVVGELAELIERIKGRPRQRLSPFLIQDDDGKPLRADGLRSRFTKARKAAGVSFQFRDIRAKAATDAGDLSHSQMLLGHKRREMTEHYVRQRVGLRVKPLR